jgi:hypothetical protein
MNKPRKLLATVAAVGAAASIVAAPTPASATSHDCTIVGPYYVSEVVDCVVWIYERAIG